VPDTSVPVTVPAHITNEDLHARLAIIESQMATMAENVNSLVALKNKGAGVLWVASIIASALFTSLIYFVSSWFGSHAAAS
jgi:hypothetical protein